MSVGNSWVKIQGTPKKPTTPLCWEAKNGKTSVGTKLILATCAINPPDKQQFMLEDMSYDDLEKNSHSQSQSEYGDWGKAFTREGMTLAGDR